VIPDCDTSNEPLGDVYVAMLLVDLLSQDHDDQHAACELDRLLAEHNVDRADVIQGVGTLISTFVAFLSDCCTNGDALHLIVPAVITRLKKIPWVFPQAIPTMAGALTAATMNLSPTGWRRLYGPWSDFELVAWTCTAWLLADMIDFACEEKDAARKLIE
jgi:hypothetical protein